MEEAPKSSRLSCGSSATQDVWSCQIINLALLNEICTFVCVAFEQNFHIGVSKSQTIPLCLSSPRIVPRDKIFVWYCCTVNWKYFLDLLSKFVSRGKDKFTWRGYGGTFSSGQLEFMKIRTNVLMIEAHREQKISSSTATAGESYE